MLSFTICWSTPDGRFGWTTMVECIDMDDAICHFLDQVIGKDPKVPWNADIEHVGPAS
jgi:hypothetical protein